MNVTIEIADSDEPRLREIAQRCGYDSVERFVSDYITEVTRQGSVDDLAPMTEEELQESVRMIEQGMEDVRAGRCYTVEEARRLTLEQLRAKHR